MTERISAGQWNRTLLRRQHLLTRVDEDAIEVIDRLVGMQSQDPRAAFYGLFSRIDGFDPTELDDLMLEREVVRIVLLRSTIFLVDGADARWIRPLAQPRIDAELRVNHLRHLVAADPDAVLTDAEQLLADGPLRGADLGQALVRRHPGESASTLTTVARCGLPLVQVPPRGLWAGKGSPTYRLLDDWIGPGEPAITGDDARAELIRLYLRGFGPATVAGIQSWSGLSGLKPLVEAMERDWELVAYEGPDGEALYDLDGLDIVDADTPAPVRLIAPFDHVLVANADRSRVADDAQYRKTVTANGRSPGFVLVDGRLAGVWHPPTGPSPGGPVEVELFDAPSARVRSELDDEVARLAQWLADYS